MVFSSYIFLFAFLPLVIVINRFLSVRISNVFLLLSSLLFYVCGESLLVLILAASILWNYTFGLLLDASSSQKKLITGIAIGGNLFLLCYYKYFGFLVENTFLSGIISESRYSDIVLPLGISFFTFQSISYLVDIYRNTNVAEKSIIRLGLYISFFPQLVAGPIVKYKELAVYLKERSATLDDTVAGIFKFIRGLAKKILIADNLALVADQIFATAPGELPTALAWLGMLLYSLQIYYDFSGYSDMAIGLCLIFGFKIPENFNYPYLSKSVREFWRRWHISVSTWFKEYLYIPLGGNRLGTTRTYFNLFIVFLLTGLWHGASWNFILWGLVHGFFMIAERLLSMKAITVPSFFKRLYLLVVVCFAWIIFRIESLTDALAYYRSLFSFNVESDWYAAVLITPYFIFLMGLALLFVFPLRTKADSLIKKLVVNNRPSLHMALCSVGYLFLAAICIMEMTTSSFSPFIYFKF